jgi:alkaline phosphatase D
MLQLDRRRLLQLGAFGTGALAIPGTAVALATARGFTHNVASGEPGHDRVMLWTRFVPAGGGDAQLEYQLSDSPEFGRIMARGAATARAERDHCTSAVADGLQPGQWYFYRFRAADGSVSPIGRTRTLPDGPLAAFTIATFSCANLPFGWFNAYAHAAERRDIDLVLHVGDYLYEYQRGRYPSAGQALAGRLFEPAEEMIELADYRLRYASYRTDPDLQRLHQLFPMVMMWDDHESANNSFRDGAENHQPETEGDWNRRKAAAMRAAREWLPLSDNAFETYQIGDLATLFRPETRLTARSEPLDINGLAGATDAAAALAALRDGRWRDPSRTMLGPAQEQQLAGAFRRSAAQGTRWQVLGQQVVVGTSSLSPTIAEWASAGGSAESRRKTALNLAAAEAGLPFNLDAWDGYPAARDRLLRSALDANANLIVLSGDTHNAWAFDLDLGGSAAGVEFGGQSVTSPGIEGSLPKIDPQVVAGTLVAHNRQLKWANTRNRGYMTLQLTPERATSEWLFLDTVRRRSTMLAGSHKLTVNRGSKRLA